MLLLPRRGLLPLFLLPGALAVSTVNPDAIARRAARKEWVRTWPAGCREYDGRKDARGRFCSLTSPTAYRAKKKDILDREDVTMTIRGVPRLRALAAAFDKRQARAGGDTRVAPTPEDHAARAALTAVERAASKYAERDGERREKARARKQEPPAERLPEEFRCTKVATEAKTPKAMEFTCSVSDYALRASSAAGEEKARPADTKSRESADERCAKYEAWRGEYLSRNGDSGVVAVSFFEAFLAAQHEPFGTLEKLRRHLHSVGGETGTVREVIERKATATYRALSRELHPDKLPKECAKETQEMMRAILDRAEALKHCILKPLRCKLNAPTPNKRTQRGMHDEV